MCNTKEYIKGLVLEVYGLVVEDSQIAPFQTQFRNVDTLPVGPFRGDATQPVQMAYYGEVHALNLQSAVSQEHGELYFPDDVQDKRPSSKLCTIVSDDPTTGHRGVYGPFMFNYVNDIRNMASTMLLFTGWRIRLSA